MVSEAKTANHQLDLLMEALKTSIRKALDEDLLVDEEPPGKVIPVDEAEEEPRSED